MNTTTITEEIPEAEFRVDTEAADVIVIDRVANQPASDYYIPALGGTVADVNPEYPADDGVIIGRYVEHIEPVGDGENPKVTYTRTSKSYTFPRSRLRQTDYGEIATLTWSDL